MKAWFIGLSERERYLLILGGGVLLVVFLWFLAWQPWMKYKLRLQEDIAILESDYAFLQQSQPHIESLRGLGKRELEGKNENVQLLVVPLLQKYQLTGDNVLKRSDARGRNDVTLQLEDAQFDQLAQFLGELESRYGIYVTTMSLVPADTLGLTGATLTLER